MTRRLERQRCSLPRLHRSNQEIAMLVEFGNSTPKNVSHSDPVVTYVNVQGDHQTFDPNVNVAEFKAHVADANENSEGVTHRPDDVALLTITNLWPAHSSKKPSWVDSDNPDF